MGKYPFLYEKESVAFMEGFTEEIGENARKLREQYLSTNNVLRFKHGRSWDSPANELGDKSGSFKKHGVETQLNLTDIAAGRVEVVFEQVSSIATSLNTQFLETLFETVGRSTEQSGNVVRADGRPAPEAMYELLEKMEISLDEDGELSMPRVFAAPSQTDSLIKQLQAAGTEFENRLEQLKARKKVEAQQKEAERLRRFEKPDQ